MAKKELLASLEQIQGLTKADRNRYKKVFGDRFGIINGLLRRYDLEPYGYSIFQCLSARTKVLFSLTREVSSGGLGVHNDIRQSFNACMGEALERYCMSYYDPTQMLYERYSNLPVRLRPNDFSLYSRQQYRKNKKFADPTTDKIFWEKIYSYTDPRQYKYWPASLIYLPFEKGRNVAETTSTGVAAHTSKDKAIIGGLLELIERDALMINFLFRLDPPEVRLESIDGYNKELIHKLLKSGYELKIYRLYSDISVPIYAGFIWTKRSNGIHYGIGASASLNSDIAVNKTLRECLFTHLYSKDMLHLKKNYKDKITALYEHFLYYQGSRFRKLLFKSSKEDYKKETVTFKMLLKKLEALDLKVFIKELTTPDINSTKIRVFRVVIPGLIDLNKSHLLPRLGAHRLWTVPRKLGMVHKTEMSDMPHPFP